MKIHAHADMHTHVNTHTHIQTDLAVPSSSYKNYCRWVKSPWPPSHTRTQQDCEHTLDSVNILQGRVFPNRVQAHCSPVVKMLQNDFESQPTVTLFFGKMGNPYAM